MKTAISLIKNNDWLTKIDIKDAYLHVPLHPSASRHLGVRLTDGTTWKFKAMPFGLNIAPLIFTRIMRMALKPLRRKGIRLAAYLDDILIISESRDQAVDSTKKTTQWLEELGFVINYKKSVLCPSQKLVFLGTMIDTCDMNLSVPTSKIIKVQREARQILGKSNWPAHKLAATIGLMNSVCKAISPGMLMTRYLLANLPEVLNENANNWNTTKVKLWTTSRQELSWWTEEMENFNGRPFAQAATELTVYTDASEQGWGGICGTDSCSRSWTDSEYSASSNMRELIAIQKVIQAMKEGGNNNIEYIQQLKDLYWTMKQLNCGIVMRHIPGKNNIFADAASCRNFKDEYYLSPFMRR